MTEKLKCIKCIEVVLLARISRPFRYNLLWTVFLTSLLAGVSPLIFAANVTLTAEYLFTSWSVDHKLSRSQNFQVFFIIKVILNVNLQTY